MLGSFSKSMVDPGVQSHGLTRDRDSEVGDCGDQFVHSRALVATVGYDVCRKLEYGAHLQKLLLLQADTPTSDGESAEQQQQDFRQAGDGGGPCVPQLDGEFRVRGLCRSGASEIGIGDQSSVHYRLFRV